jgi:tRNA A-37 threonylcarbamoyl transferase component Bud32
MRRIYINGQLTTVKQIIGEGQEAVVYRLSPTEVAKIYRQPDDPYYQGNIIEQKAAKIRLANIQSKLLSFPKVLPPHVISPKNLAYDGKQQVVGYVMNYIDKAHTLLQYGDKMFRTQAGITNNAVVEVFKDLHKSVEGLHKKQVVIGDFNDMNVLVKNTDAYLIDADSWQFGKYTCTMYTDKFVDPNICSLQNSNGIDLMSLKSPHNQLSDWYAFSALLWKALLFVDPYGGMYKPKDKQKIMKQHLRPLHKITVMNPDVIYPKHAYPHNVLSKDMHTWMEQTLGGNKREIFPYHLLEQMHWQSCSGCGIEYATPQCPLCHQTQYHTLPQQIVHGNVKMQEIVRTNGTLVYVTIHKDTLQYVLHENSIFHREDGNSIVQGDLHPSITFRIQGNKSYMMNGSYITCYEPYKAPVLQLVDSVGTKSSFDANSSETCYIEDGKIMKEIQTIFGPKKVYVGQAIEQQTLIWQGDQKGFGFYKAGSIMQGILIQPGERYTVNIDLPIISGSIIDMQCVQSSERYWLLCKTKRGSEYYNICIALNTLGKVLGQYETKDDDDTWLGTIYGKTAAGTNLFSPTDKGIVRTTCDNGQWQEQIFSATEPFVHSKCQLLGSSKGIYVITAKTIRLLSM